MPDQPIDEDDGIYTATWAGGIRIEVKAQYVDSVGWRFEASGIDPDDDGENTRHKGSAAIFPTADAAIAAGIELLRLFYDEGADA